MLEKKYTDTFKTGEIENFLTVNDVRAILRTGVATIIDLVRESDLIAYNGSGRPLDLESLNPNTRGLRFKPSDVEAYIESLRLY